MEVHYIEVLETVLGKKAKLDLLPMQPGDVPATMADTSELDKAVGYKPATTIDIGVRNFVRWFKDYYSVD